MVKLDLDKIKNNYEEDIIRFRRTLHMNPELSFKEYETTELIKDMLISKGIKIVDIGLETGVIGLLEGKKDGPTIALRGDIDALPIQELNKVPYKSKIDGAMHACGHDFHAASAMGAALILADLKDELEGNIVFIFQPAEEKNAGAKMIVEKGLFSKINIDAIFGLHNHPDVPWGKVAVKEGGLMAAVDTIKIRVKGLGGHGGIPNETKDPIVATCAMIMNLQTIVSRNTNPLETAVISIGTFNAGEANNVISEEVELTGTVRSFNKDVQQMLAQRIKEVLDYTAKVYNVEVELDYLFDLPAVFNEKEMTDLAYKATSEIIGEENIVVPTPSMGGEDFSIFTEEVPGFFFWLGVGNEEKGMVHQWHSPRFDGDERSLIIGSAVLANLGLYGLKHFSK